MYGCGKDRQILIPFRLPQISSFTLRLKRFSSDSDNCPDMGIGPLLQFPHPPSVGPILWTLLVFSLVPSSYQVFHGSIYSFPLVTSSFPFSSGVLHALLCLKVYSWFIHRERCTPHPPTPPPSCSLHSVIFEIAPKYYILDSFVDNEGYAISCKGLLPTEVDIIVIWIKSAHSSPF